MTLDELMSMAAEKAAKELSKESIEFLFKPITMFDLLLRSDFEGMTHKFYEAIKHDLLTNEACVQGQRRIQIEEFYRKIRDYWNNN